MLGGRGGEVGGVDTTNKDQGWTTGWCEGFFCEESTPLKNINENCSRNLCEFDGQCNALSLNARKVGGEIVG